jgi:hypothetical protein
MQVVVLVEVVMVVLLHLLVELAVVVLVQDMHHMLKLDNQTLVVEEEVVLVALSQHTEVLDQMDHLQVAQGL